LLVGLAAEGGIANKTLFSDKDVWFLGLGTPGIKKTLGLVVEQNVVTKWY
jgi:hypothetical protein